MWTCAAAFNPTFAQSAIPAGSLADMREEAHATMFALPHDYTHPTSHAVMFTSSVAATQAEHHADNPTLLHIASAYTTAREHERLRARPLCQLSHNPTSQQESMHT